MNRSTLHSDHAVTQDQRLDQASPDYQFVFRNLFSQAPLGLYQADASGTCKTDVRHRDGGGWTGFEACWPVSVHPDDRDSIAVSWQEAMESGVEWSREVRFRSKEGEISWLHATIRQLRDDHGAVVGYLGCNVDITARMAALDELLISEDRYRMAMDAASCGIWDLDVATNQCYFSPYCFETLGYDLSRLRGNLRDWVDIMHPEDVAGVCRVKDDCIAGSQPNFKIEFRLETKEGTWKWFACKGKSALEDASGKSLRMIGTLVDISERKMTETMLRVEHDLLDLITATSPVGIMFVGGDGEIAFVNPRAELILGQSKEEIMRRGCGSPVWQNTAPDGKPSSPADAQLHEALETGRTLVNTCCSVKRPNGKRVLLSINAAPFLDAAGEVGGTVVILEDVTEQKQHEQVLADNDRLLRETQRIAQLGSYVLDVADDRWACSSKLFEILGMDEGAPLNIQGHINVVHPDFREKFIDGYLAAIAGAQHFEMEYKVKRLNDGAERWVAECCEQNHDETGKVSRMIGTIQDITERKAAEEAIRSLNDELDRRVIERTSQLAAAKKEIESFSYSVSHDLRAPLRHINSYSAILLEDHGGSLSVEARYYLDRICTASKRMGKLIDDLLTLTRVGRTNMKRESFDISNLAREVADMLREAEPDCRANFVIQPGLSADADSILVRLVLENMLGNSMKYASRKHAARIEFGETMINGRPAFFVRDDGVGFNMAYARNLFQPFQRLHGAEFEGTGIGLATVRRVIERHGGSIWAEGKENEGATFYFTLSSGPKARFRQIIERRRSAPDPALHPHPPQY